MSSSHSSVWKNNETPEILRWFKSSHLPDDLREISGLFASTAHIMCKELQNGPERATALRKLLEAKDAAVRQRIADREHQ